MLGAYIHVAMISPPIRETYRFNIIFDARNAESSSYTFCFKSCMTRSIDATWISYLGSLSEVCKLRIAGMVAQETIKTITVVFAYSGSNYSDCWCPHVEARDFPERDRWGRLWIQIGMPLQKGAQGLVGLDGKQQRRASQNFLRLG